MLFLQVNETILRSIVTYPDIDYFFVDNFSGLAAILDRLIVQACRSPCITRPTTPVPSPPFTSPPHIGASTLQFLHTFSNQRILNVTGGNISLCNVSLNISIDFYRATRMHRADYAVVGGILSKRLHISSKFFHCRLAPPF